MKRRVAKVTRRILVFLLLGAIFNVAVAWGLTFFNPFTGGTKIYARDFFKADYADWWVETRSTPAGQHVRSEWVKGSVRGNFSRTRQQPQGLVAEWCQVISPGFPNSPNFSRFVETQATGWPEFALLSVAISDISVDEESQSHQASIVHGIRLANYSTPWGPQEKHFLPVVPIWPGFAINTAFYATVLWLSAVGFGALRRRRRIRRGLCPKCAYDLRGGNHAACPECGKAVRRQ